MVSPAPVNPPGHVQTAPPPNELAAGLSRGVKTSAGFLRTFGFQLLVLLLGIALAFM
jgi:hypothetical protein